jgi:hypothetical protein
MPDLSDTDMPDPDLAEEDPVQGFWPHYNLEPVIRELSATAKPVIPDAARPNGVPPYKEPTWNDGVEHDFGSYPAFDLQWDRHPLPTDYHIDVVERTESSGQTIFDVAVVQERLPDPANPISELASGTTTAVIGRYASSDQAAEVQNGLTTVRSEVFDVLGTGESDLTARSQANGLMVTTAYEIAAANGEVSPYKHWGRLFPFPDPAFDERTPSHQILTEIEASLSADLLVQPTEAGLSVEPVQNESGLDL